MKSNLGGFLIYYTISDSQEDVDSDISAGLSRRKNLILKDEYVCTKHIALSGEYGI